MRHYQQLLFDLDDTLLDFKGGESQALKKLFAHQALELTPQLVQAYERKNNALWSAFEQGLIPREQVLAERFTYLFSQCGVVRDGAEMDCLFRGYLKEEALLLAGAMTIVTELAQVYSLYLVTNGVSETQRYRLEKSGLAPYFDGVYVSDETGYQKPMPEYFQFIFSTMGEPNLAETLIIGDSLAADILGGQQAGIASCWYNPHKKANQTEIQPTYEINHLLELRQLLLT